VQAGCVSSELDVNRIVRSSGLTFSKFFMRILRSSNYALLLVEGRDSLELGSFSNKVGGQLVILLWIIFYIPTSSLGGLVVEV